MRIISSVIAAGTIAAVLAAATQPMWAQAYPSHPIHLIVNFAPGGAGDILGRIIGNQLGVELHQSVIVENRAGAGGTIGARDVVNATSGWLHADGRADARDRHQSVFHEKCRLRSAEGYAAGGAGRRRCRLCWRCRRNRLTRPQPNGRRRCAPASAMTFCFGRRRHARPPRRRIVEAQARQQARARAV